MYKRTGNGNTARRSHETIRHDVGWREVTSRGFLVIHAARPSTIHGRQHEIRRMRPAHASWSESRSPTHTRTGHTHAHAQRHTHESRHALGPLGRGRRHGSRRTLGRPSAVAEGAGVWRCSLGVRASPAPRGHASFACRRAGCLRSTRAPGALAGSLPGRLQRLTWLSRRSLPREAMRASSVISCSSRAHHASLRTHHVSSR